MCRPPQALIGSDWKASEPLRLTVPVILALGQKLTFGRRLRMSALPPRADIGGTALSIPPVQESGRPIVRTRAGNCGVLRKIRKVSRVALYKQGAAPGLGGRRGRCRGFLTPLALRGSRPMRPGRLIRPGHRPLADPKIGASFIRVLPMCFLH